MIFKFIGFFYLKFIVIIFLSLQVFFMGIDILKYSDNLPESANLFVLFLAYDFLYALNYTFPIATILASVVTYILLIKSNQLMAILSIGYSKKMILFPILLIAIVLNLFYIGLNTTPFVYAQENIDNIIQRGGINDAKTDLLVKYNNDYVYIGKIYPILQKAENIKIFETKDLFLNRYIQADEAQFDGKWWKLKTATITYIPKMPEFNKSKLQIQNVNNYQILKNFKPKILDTIYQNKPNVSMADAINAFFLLENQNSNTQKIRSILYSFIAIPLAIPFTIIIISFYVPDLVRYTNLAKLGFIFILMCLIIWGLFFMLTKLSISGFLSPEIGILAPLFLLITISIFYYKKI